MSSVEQNNSIKYSDSIQTTANIATRLATIANYSDDDATIVASIDAIQTELDAIDARAALVFVPRQTDRTPT